KVFVSNVNTGTASAMRTAYNTVEWVGFPLKNPLVSYRSLADGLIPTFTRLRFRVNRPYAPYLASADTSAAALPGAVPGYATNPYYTFSTKGLAPHKMTAGDTTDRGHLLSRIQ